MLSLLRVTIGYGHGWRYFWALYWVAGLAFLGTIVLRQRKNIDRIFLWIKVVCVRRKSYGVLVRFVRRVQRTGSKGSNKGIEKLGLWYSLDMLLPVIRLREKHYEVDLEGGVRYYFYVHKVVGYLLMFFVVAGLTGLTD